MTIKFMDLALDTDKAAGELRAAKLSKETLELLKRAFGCGFSVDQIYDVSQSIDNDDPRAKPIRLLKSQAEHHVDLNSLTADLQFKAKNPEAADKLCSLLNRLDLSDEDIAKEAKSIIRPILDTKKELKVSFRSPSSAQKRANLLYILATWYQSIRAEIQNLPVDCVQDGGAGADWIMCCCNVYAKDSSKKTAKKLVILGHSGYIRDDWIKLNATKEKPLTLEVLSPLIADLKYYDSID